jgi:hypothetical protein
MLLQIRKHDGSTEEIEVLRSGFACEIATAFDWDAERRRFEQLAESEGESYLPSIAFTDDAGRTLEFGPNTDDTFWLSYCYSTVRSTFGFCPVDQPREQQLEACALKTALDLLEQHYGSKHLDIVSALPEQCDPDNGGNQRIA